jgi:hypothetical protein
LVVAIGPTSVGYSLNGDAWNAGTTPAPSSTWKDGCYGSAGFLVVGTNGKVMLSVDGITWEQIIGLVASFQCQGCTYSPELDMYLICGFDGSSNGIVYQFNPGDKSFTQRNFGSGCPYTYIRWAVDTFLVGASAGTVRLRFSTNGTSWTNVTPTTVNTLSVGATHRILNGIAGSQLFMVVGGSSFRVSQTEDIQGTWITRNPPSFSNFVSDILPIPGTQRVIIGANDSNVKRTDQAGASWTTVSMPNTQNGRMSYSPALNKIFMPASGSTTHLESSNQASNFQTKNRGAAIADAATVIIPRA